MRSLLAPWIGGASNPVEVAQAGYRSMLAFWAGGACASVTPDENVDDGLFGDDKVEARSQKKKPSIYVPTFYRVKEDLEDLSGQIALKEAEQLLALQSLLEAQRNQALKERQQAEILRLNGIYQGLLREIDILLIEQIRLKRMLQDEEDVMILLMSMPFIN